MHGITARIRSHFGQLVVPKIAKKILVSTLVLIIVKSIYGMVQAARAWQDTFSKAIKELKLSGKSLKQLRADPCVCVWRHRLCRLLRRTGPQPSGTQQPPEPLVVWTSNLLLESLQAFVF